ncbi:rho GTPase-activating protein 32 isoform X2 [Bombina bombina]|uniref:rho GTPase-activating protein 32 isoform X2 n=1 Tax=Bombina bombina TaxID=8345 RepID=UPI00235ABB07|nr:rho GTPase-activating protein 32 isoform X2 [Bombina bombina]
MEGGTDSAFALSFPSIRSAAPSAAGRMATGCSLDELERIMKSSLHMEEDDFVPELPRSIHPRERPDWEETISAMARGADIPVPGEIQVPAELPMRSCGSTASMKVKNVKKLSFTKGHFPKLAECAHFHYENVDFGNIQLTLTEEQNEVSRNGCESKELVFLVQIACQGRSWIIKRSYEDFRVLDKHLHLCIYDRRFSQLAELPRSDSVKDSPELVTQMLMAYLSRLSAIAGNKINCGPALTWMEIDNKGNHLLVHEESSINVPAIAAAHVIKRYNAQAPDELSFEVGDIVSVIDMPPKELTTWWRGKHGFQVGFFPSECVELINDKVPQSMTNSVPKPVSPAHGMRPASWSYFPPYLEMDSVSHAPVGYAEVLSHYQISSVSRKHGKLITFLRTFMKSRPSKQKLKQRGILRERVFGCDLGEHLLNSGQDVPQVLRSCTEFIEKHGIVDGIYRLSGIASNIQKLRHEFDSEQIPDLTKDVYIQDIHCVGSLCKLYFRELPNPLLTYQLYEKFSDAVSAATDEERLVKIHDVIQQLPPPHYRTLEFLMRHLSRLATYCSITNMHTKNLAIVWAPNLLRSKQIESACFSGTAAFMEVRIQSVVVEFILNHVEVLFSPKLSSVIREGAGAHTSLSRPKSLLVSSPSTKLLSLEEAQARTQAQINSPVVADSKYIEVGEGPAALQGKFHTVIDFPSERKRPPTKVKKSPVGSWRSFFNLGKSSSSSSMSKRKLQRNPSEPSEMKALAFPGGRGDTGTMRSAKSEESLSSLHADGESKLFRPRRPRSSSDALSASYNGDILDSCNRYNSYDNLPQDQDSDGDEGLIHVPAMLTSRSHEDEDLSPPDIGVASLDFDPMSFQCSPPQLECDIPESNTPHVDFTTSNSKERLPFGLQTPGSGTSSEPMSPFQDRITSPFLTPDRSPSAEKAQKPPTFAEKMVHAFSPKIGRKVVRSPPLTISDPVTISLPSRVSEMMGSMQGAVGGTQSLMWFRDHTATRDTGTVQTLASRPADIAPINIPKSIADTTIDAPQIYHWSTSEIESDDTARLMCQAISQQINNSELENVESCNEELNTSNLSGASHVEETELPSLDHNKSIPTVPTPPGASTLESMRDAVAVSSVSFIPPPPPPKNAARMLALALAESAQQACTQSQKRPPCHFDDLPSPPPSDDQQVLEVSSHKMAPLPAPPETSTSVTSLKISPATTPSTSSSFSVTTIQQSPVSGQTPTTGQSPSSITPPGYSPSTQVAVAIPPDDVQPTGSTEMNASFTTELLTAAVAGSSPSSSDKPRDSPRPHLHQRSESFPSHPTYNVAPPVPPVRTMESRLATAIHSNYDTINASNYHSLLSTMMLPSSLEDALPRHNYSAHIKSESMVDQAANYRHPYPSQVKSEDAVEMADTYRHTYSSVSKPENTEPINNYRHPYPSQVESETTNEPLDAFLHHNASTMPKSYRAESIPQHIPPQIYGSRCDTSSSSSTLYGTYVRQAKHSALQHIRARNRPDYMGCISPGVRSYSEEPPPYPTIRRVQSLHVPIQPPPPPMRTVPITRTEVPPDDEPTFCPRPLYQYKSCSPFSSQSDYHVTQLQPYFENGRVHYRYSPYSGSTTYYSSDGTFYDMDPYSTLRLRQLHLYPSRDFASYTTRLQPKAAYRSQGLPPYPRGTLREHNFISRDVPPAMPPELPRPLHISWDMEDMDRYRLQSLRRENRARQRAKGPVMSQYDNVSTSLVEDVAGLDVIHLRSRSDPGKTPGLLSVAETKDVHQGRAEGDERKAHPPPAYGNGHQDKPSLPQKQQSSGTRGRMQHDLSSEHRPQPHQDPGSRQTTDGRNGPPFSSVEYGSKGLPNLSEPTLYHSTTNKYNIPQQEPMRLNHKEIRLSEDHIRPAEKPHRDCYREEPAAFSSAVPPPKPERSHSLRGHNTETLERDPAIFYPYQTLHGKRHSSITALPQYDNLADYHSIPHHRSSNQPPNAFPLPHGRTYATALGQGAFLAAELSLSRPEAKIHAE